MGTTHFDVVQAAHQDDVEAIAADGPIAIKSKTVIITKGSLAVLTLAAPTAMVHDGVRINIVSSTAFAHTVTAAGNGFNAGGAGSDVGTFGVAIGNAMSVVAYQGEWYAENLSGVTLA